MTLRDIVTVVSWVSPGLIKVTAEYALDNNECAKFIQEIAPDIRKPFYDYMPEKLKEWIELADESIKVAIEINQQSNHEKTKTNELEN